jgi:lipoprotein Spr
MIEYTKIPFKANGRDFSGADCWGLVWLIYRYELGIDLPTYTHYDANTLREVAKAMMTHSIADDWIEVDEPKKFDVVVMRARVRAMDGKRRSLPIHVGVAVDKYRFIHCEQGVNTVVERFSNRVIMPRIEKICRHKECL